MWVARGGSFNASPGESAAQYSRTASDTSVWAHTRWRCWSAFCACSRSSTRRCPREGSIATEGIAVAIFVARLLFTGPLAACRTNPILAETRYVSSYFIVQTWVQIGFLEYW